MPFFSTTVCLIFLIKLQTFDLFSLAIIGGNVSTLLADALRGILTSIKNDLITKPI